MFVPSTWSLRTHLRAHALLSTLLPCLLMAGCLAYFLSQRLHASYAAQMRHTLELQRHFVDTWLGDRTRDVLRLAAIPELRSQDIEKTGESFRRFLEVMPEFRGLGFADAQGLTVLDTLASPGLYLGDRSYFHEGRQGRPYVSDLLVGRATGTRLIIFSAPVAGPAREFRGIVFAPVSLEVIVQAVGGERMDFGGRTLLIDRDGQVIAGEEHLAPNSGAWRQAGDSRAAFRMFDYMCNEGTPMTAMSVPLSTGWSLLAVIPQEALRQAVRPVVAAVFAAGLLSFFILLPFVLRFSRSVGAAVDPLIRQAEALSRGDYSQAQPLAAPGKSPRELAVLAQAFETMRARIVQDVKKLESVALTDELTGLPNRRCLMEEGLRLLELCARSGLPCSCLLLDVDNFKTVNDRFGHAKGDQVLAGMAALIKRTARGADLFGRLGGEEFLLVCADTGQEQALVLAQRLRAAVAGAREELLPPEGVTVSVGVATLRVYREPGTVLFDRLLVAADMAMYEAKAAGRDQVRSSLCDPGASACTADIP